MSKVFETNALKGKALADGMRKKIAELNQYGVNEWELIEMSNDADKAIEMIREVEQLREVVSEKLKSANKQLDSVKERALAYRRIIKAHYTQDKWESFGLMDKR